MVTKWLKRNYNVKRFGEPTWQKLVEAVGHPAGGANMATARDIAKRHKAGGVLGRLSLCALSSDSVSPRINSDVAYLNSVTDASKPADTTPTTRRGRNSNE